jgi:hypothetical protein
MLDFCILKIRKNMTTKTITLLAIAITLLTNTKTNAQATQGKYDRPIVFRTLQVTPVVGFGIMGDDAPYYVGGLGDFLVSKNIQANANLQFGKGVIIELGGSFLFTNKMGNKKAKLFSKSLGTSNNGKVETIEVLKTIVNVHRINGLRGGFVRRSSENYAVTGVYAGAFIYRSVSHTNANMQTGWSARGVANQFFKLSVDVMPNAFSTSQIILGNTTPNTKTGFGLGLRTNAQFGLYLNKMQNYALYIDFEVGKYAGSKYTGSGPTGTGIVSFGARFNLLGTRVSNL